MTFTCLDLQSGKRRWKGGRYGSGQVLMLADQPLLVVVTDTGEVVLVAADPNRHHELGRFQLGKPDESTPDNDPRQIVARTIGYLEGNRTRMNYPEYRRQGLPVTTAWMESLVKEVNYRAKGTEMFWNDPDGAEAILQVRASTLCRFCSATTELASVER